jgi:DNA-binding SARP family transcriptional activator
MLSELVESSALNERFCEQLMIALYRSGQQAVALSSYRRMRERLDDELGVEPTVRLCNLFNAILVHHPALRVGADHVVLRSLARVATLAVRGPTAAGPVLVCQAE